jgi:hypothetical protein
MLNDALGFCSVCQKWLDDEEYKKHPGKCKEHFKDELKEREICRSPGESDDQFRKRIENKMNGSTINHNAIEVYKKTKIMILKWRQENRGRRPKYLFLSNDAFTLLAAYADYDLDLQRDRKTFMGVEIAPVGVPGIYAGIGEDF